MDAFVRGPHDSLLPVTDDRGAWGRGRCGRPWPERARDVPVRDLRSTAIDAVVLQRPEELELVERWTGRRPGSDLPAVFVEHNAPRGSAAWSRHPLAERYDIPIVHVTHFNALMWDCGAAPTRVIEHGVPDPGHLYSGELPRAAVVINEPVRRWRTVGADLLPRFAAAVPLDVYGMGTSGLGRVDFVRSAPAEPDRPDTAPHDFRVHGDLDTSSLHKAMARRRLYLHSTRWTSLGIALVEAMMLGMPIVAAATTAAPHSVPEDAGVVSADLDALVTAATRLAADPALAYEAGAAARDHALAHFGLDRFLADWDALWDSVAPRPRVSEPAPTPVSTGGDR